MFGWFKKKTVLKLKSNNAMVVVHYGDNEIGVITRGGYAEYWWDGWDAVNGDKILASYLNNLTGFIKLDEGSRIPLCKIKKIEPITIAEIELEVEI